MNRTEVTAAWLVSGCPKAADGYHDLENGVPPMIYLL
jgi:hypothetical protein